MHSHAHTYTHAQLCVHIQTHTHMYKHTNTHSCAHTNTPVDFPLLSPRIYWPALQSSGVGCLPGGRGEHTQTVLTQWEPLAPSHCSFWSSPET